MLTGRAGIHGILRAYDSVSPTLILPRPARLSRSATPPRPLAGAGLAKARDIMGGKENIIAVIGDGSMSGGEALIFERCRRAEQQSFYHRLHDNQMSIAANHGGMYDQLAELLH